MPIKQSKETRNQQIIVLVSEEEKNMAKELALAKDTYISEIVRKLIVAEHANLKKTNNGVA